MCIGIIFSIPFILQTLVNKEFLKGIQHNMAEKRQTKVKDTNNPTEIVIYDDL